MLENLNQLALEAKQRSDNYDKKEFVFSSDFKSKFKELLPNYKIEFYNYTSIVTTSKNLLIILPNQWFVIASFFNDYISELIKYKKIVDEFRIDDKKILSMKNNNTIDIVVEKQIIDKFDNIEDADKFRKFLTNYEWWFGSKTIDRSDYFVSSVLNLAGVINNSQSYIADLAYTLSDHKDLNDILQNDYESYLNQSILKTNEIESSLIEEKFLRNIIFESFKYVLKEYGEENAIGGYEIKDSIIEDREYRGLTLPDFFGFEIIFAIFDEPLDVGKLKSSNTKRYFEEPTSIIGNEYSYFTTQWNSDSRGLSLLNFNKYLSAITNNDLEIIKDGKVYKLIKKNKKTSPLKKAINRIYYGSPGTGKSYVVNEILNPLDFKFYERITFHPEYDNACFVGGYKPISEIIEFIDENDEVIFKDEIKYKYVPQVFTNIYIKAWQDLENQYYLALEEINRGNCAEIFGDIFQLLDRNSGYTVSPSNELQKYIIEKLGSQHEGIAGGMKLPSNLSILATMNTSDQSLFPMDSAFKRRWDWEYIPICYTSIDDFKNINESFDYEIDIEDGQKYSWIKYIEKINLNHIKNNSSLGMDKCIGNYFIKPDNDKTISLRPFINKVIFYLWNDVFKDEDNKVFEENTSYEDFFPINTSGKKKIKELFERIDLKPIVELKVVEEDSQLGQVAEESEEIES